MILVAMQGGVLVESLVAILVARQGGVLVEILVVRQGVES